MNWTGGADRPGPAPSSMRGTPKSEEWCGKPARLHGPLLLGCGQGLAPQGSSANEGRFRQFRTCGVHGPKTCQPWPLSSCTRSTRQTSRASWGYPSPPGRAVQGRGQNRLPDLAYFACARTGRGPCPKTGMSVISRGQAFGITKDRSAPGLRQPLRDQVVAGVHAIDRDGGECPPIGIGAEPLDRDPPPRQQANERHA